MSEEVSDEMLDRVETDRLFDALSRRFKIVTLLAVKHYGGENGEEEMAGWYHGGMTAAWGLIARAPSFFDMVRSKNSKPPHPD